jgi:hypothetical protein
MTLDGLRMTNEGLGMIYSGFVILRGTKDLYGRESVV